MDFTASRAVRLPKCVEGAGQKEVSCAGLRGRVLGAAVPQGGCRS